MPDQQRTKRSNGARKGGRRRRRRGRNRNSNERAREIEKPPSSPQKGVGSTIGATLGNWAESGIRSLFGGGDYAEEFETAGGFDVGENSIVKPLTSSAVPLLNSTDLKDGHIRVKHREFIADLTTQTESVFLNAVLNPTDSTSFPWLSQIAVNFQQWIPHGIVIEFVSTSGSAVGANTALGSVSIATVYDADNFAPFATKAELLNTYFAVSGKPSENLMHAIECDPEEMSQRVLLTALPGPGLNNGPNWYSLGIVSILTTGAQVPTAIGGFVAGELWVTYDISLLKPKVATVAPLADKFTQSAFARFIKLRLQQQCQETGKTPCLTDCVASAELRSEFLLMCKAQLQEEEQKLAESPPPPCLEIPSLSRESTMREWELFREAELGLPPSVLARLKAQRNLLDHNL